MSTTRPYRTPGEVEEDPPPAPVERSLGGVRSVHAPPPLRRSLIAPILFPIIMLAVMCVMDVPVWIATGIAVPTFAILAWSPLRTIGLEVTLHTDGVVVSQGKLRTEVFFEDINEVWFEISSFKYNHVLLSALRLVDFDGRTHRVPLTVSDSIALGNTILRAYGTPLLRDARKALLAGETLVFGSLQLSRDGITVKGAHAAWGEIRRAFVQPGRIAFYRRLPIFAWRTVRLDRIPNPTIFSVLVGEHVKLAVDSPLVIEGIATQAQVERKSAFRSMIIGGGVFFIGLVFTVNSYVASRFHFIAFGPMIFGSIMFLRGLKAFRRER